MALSRDQILGATDFVFVELEVEEWGGTVRLRGLSASERDAFESSVGVAQDLTNLRSRLVVNCLVDDNGERLFKDSEAKLLGEKNANVINRLFDEVRNLSGMSDDEIGAAEGNSKTQ